MRKPGLYIMSAFYILAGINHFRSPGIYATMMPSWMPWHDQLIFISGVLEILLGVLLLFKVSRTLAAWGIIFLLVAVFPANIQMTINYVREHRPGAWITFVRLPIQFLLIWWAYQYTKNKRTLTSIPPTPSKIGSGIAP